MSSLIASTQYGVYTVDTFRSKRFVLECRLRFEREKVSCQRYDPLLSLCRFTILIYSRSISSNKCHVTKFLGYVVFRILHVAFRTTKSIADCTCTFLFVKHRFLTFVLKFLQLVGRHGKMFKASANLLLLNRKC